MSGPWEKYTQPTASIGGSGPWSKYTTPEKPAPQRDVVATTDDGGVVYRSKDGSLGFTSPGFSTVDPATIEKIMQGATPAEVSTSNFDQDAISQAPIASRAVKAVEGVPFVGSYLDEAAGAMFGDHAKQGIRAVSGAMDRENPGESTALNIGGAVAGSIPVALTAGPALLANGARTLGGKALQVAGIGAATGAVEGAVYGSGEGTTAGGRAGNAQQGAVWGGVVGGALGAAAPYASEGIKRALMQMRGSDVGAISKTLSISPAAARVVKNALDSGDMSKAQDALIRAGDNAMIADAGLPTQQLLDAAASTGGAAARITNEAVDQRVAGATKEMTSLLDRFLGKPVGAKAMARNVREGTAAARSETYGAAYAVPIDYSGGRGRMLEGLLSRVPDSAIKDANALMRAEGFESAQIIAKIADNGKVTYETLPDVRQIDYITRALSGVADKADGAGKLGGQTPLGRAYNDLTRNIRNVLKAEVPAYKKALDTASDAISRVKAGEVGLALLRPGTTRETVGDAIRNASKAERKAIREGIRTHIDDILANVARTITDPDTDAREGVKLLREMSSRANRTKLRMVLGKKASEKMLDELDRTATAFELRAALAQNSKTAIRQSIQGSIIDQTAPSALETLASGEPMNAAKRFVQIFTGSSDEAKALRASGIYEEIATALTQIKGHKGRSALKIVESAMNGQRITEQKAAFIGSVLSTNAALAGNREGTRLLTTQ